MRPDRSGLRVLLALLVRRVRRVPLARRVTPARPGLRARMAALAPSALLVRTV
ncbi:hypothetical protein OG897_03320 [Streptomyces sp. NBC_00237]|uniref:hypothetical protein n=1 Tax=Streptomyces sp. NBC_00237 TaxID=2975687 RepID=UPI002258C4A9|nr:hypothetical protein [Streptomyces sp. NBC_00237]MCX5200495.1 hypothetical protein [Streptomyces sp. NBC_00237]